MNWLGIIAVILSLASIKFLLVSAGCEGSVTFYWTEKGNDRIENMRNYGLLEEKLEDRKYEKLQDYFNPENVYAYTVEGDCCWRVYGAEKFKSPSHKLRKGFSGIPDFPQFNVNSMRRIKC